MIILTINYLWNLLSLLRSFNCRSTFFYCRMSLFPLLFGNVWMKLMKIDRKWGKNKAKANQSMAIMFLLVILTFYFAHLFLSCLKKIFQITNVAWIWLGLLCYTAGGFYGKQTGKTFCRITLINWFTLIIAAVLSAFNLMTLKKLKEIQEIKARNKVDLDKASRSELDKEDFDFV